MVAFLDYGFTHVGGVKYEPKTFEVAKDNFIKFNEDSVELICGDARNVKEELDAYNWFYFFFPFDKEIFEIVIDNIKQSYLRKKKNSFDIFYGYGLLVHRKNGYF